MPILFSQVGAYNWLTELKGCGCLIQTHCKQFEIVIPGETLLTDIYFIKVYTSM